MSTWNAYASALRDAADLLIRLDRPDNEVMRTGSETNVVRHIVIEMSARGWKQSDLCRRMARARRPIHPSELSRLLNGQEHRRLSIDQLIGLAEVFEYPINYLLLPPRGGAA